MRPHYSHSSRENATPSSGTSLLASCKGVPTTPPPPLTGKGKGREFGRETAREPLALPARAQNPLSLPFRTSATKATNDLIEKTEKTAGQFDTLETRGRLDRVHFPH